MSAGMIARAIAKGLRIDVSSAHTQKLQNAVDWGRKILQEHIWMPRYFFTIRRPGRVKDDPHGTDLPDVPAALSHAERKIRELRKESPYNDPALVMIVKDEARKMVLSLPFFPGC